MAKGRQKHQARLDAINQLGKDLARRAGRACELCSSREGCRTYDLEPEKKPELSTLILLCASCTDRVERPGQTPPDHLRFVANHCWSDVAPVQTMVQRLLEPIRSEDWAGEALENLAMMQQSASDDS